MFFILSKLLSFVLQPLIWVVLFSILGFSTKSASRRKKYFLSSFITLLFFSNSFIFNEVSRLWENQLTPYNGNENFDVAIILGGLSSYDSTHNQQTFFGNSERLLNVLPLYFDGKVNKILFAGGSGNLDQKIIEGNYIKTYLLSIGVKAEDLIIENKSKNTFENAKYALELVPQSSSILLSTSATHMPRSLACFNKLGSNPTPFPVDFVSYNDYRFSLSNMVFPNPKIMEKWYWLTHEWVGMIVYKIKGYN